MNTAALRMLGIWIATLLIWEAAYRVIGWRPWIFPAPSHVIDATLNMLNVRTHFGEPLHRGWPMSQAAGGLADQSSSSLLKSPLLGAVVVSAARLACGFSISIALGGTIGLFMWRFKWLDDFLGSLF